MQSTARAAYHYEGTSLLAVFDWFIDGLTKHNAMLLDLIKMTDQLTLASQLGEDHQTRKDASLDMTSPWKDKNQIKKDQ